MNEAAASPEQLLSRARQALEANRRDLTLEALRTLTARGPDLGKRWIEAAEMAAQIGDMRTAIAAQQRAIADAPGDIDRRFALSRLLGRFNRTREGMEIAEAILARFPNSEPARFRVATFAAHLGMIDRATTLFREIVEANPDSAEAWAQLQNLERADRAGDDLKALKAARKRLRKSDPPTRATIEFALGDALHKLGEADDAFAHFSAGAAIMARHDPYGGDAFDGYVARIIEAFDAAFFEARAMQGGPDRPIFVLGMARSGTTLLQRLLTAHSGVAGGGELTAMRVATYPLGRFQPERLAAFEQRFSSNRADPWTAIGDVYARLVGEQFSADGRVVDKAINLPFMAGAARAGLPAAPMVWIRRDPCDVAWSTFRIRLMNQQNWSWRLEDIAHRMVHFDRLRAHFCALFPDDILRVEYEDLAREPDVWIPKILSHCGLAEEDVQARFHEIDQAVPTASMTSVREPITTKSIGRWKAYEKHMQPFIDAYERLTREG